MLHNTTVAQNKAHRTDLNWIRVGTSEHMRSDGVTIRRDPNANRWFLYLPDGQPAALPLGDGKFATIFRASAHSLTWAKLEAGQIGADSPACEPRR